MALTSIDLQDLFKNMSNAFVGTVAELWQPEEERDEDDKDVLIRVITKENRHMYLALLLIAIMILANAIL